MNSTYEIALDNSSKEINWTNDKCDNYDYMIAIFCGAVAGIVDSLFVGSPLNSKLGTLSDSATDNMVKKIANMLWQADGRSTSGGKSKLPPDTLDKSIAYLERSFPVNYDARYAKDLLDPNGALSSMSPKNHHLMSLAHSPDIVGLIFSILDQFTGQASFINNGKIIQLIPIKDSRNNKISYMQGTTFESKLFCGICNWLGHLASDISGSSSTRVPNKSGRGSGLPLPFYELILLSNNDDSNGFAQIAIKVFEDGYDLRFGMAMSIPVMISELSVKVLWAFKKHYYSKKEWSYCLPSNKYSDLRLMLLISNATLCLFDASDATIRTALKGGNPVTFVLHLNYVAWARLLVLVFRELRIRYGSKVDNVINRYFAEIGLNDAYALREYYNRMNTLDQKLALEFKNFIAEIEKTHTEFINQANNSLNSNIGTSTDRMNNSIAFAKTQHVNQTRILTSTTDLTTYFSKSTNNSSNENQLFRR